jgi:hypothetical protein
VDSTGSGLDPAEESAVAAYKTEISTGCQQGWDRLCGLVVRVPGC